MGKNILNYNVSLVLMLLLGTVVTARAEEMANDLWIVEPTAGDKLKNVMKETVDGVMNNQASIIKQSTAEKMATIADEKTTANENIDAVLNEVEAISQATIKQPVSFANEGGLENATIEEEIKSDVIINKDLPELKPADILKGYDELRSAAIVRRVFKPTNKNIEIIEIEPDKSDMAKSSQNVEENDEIASNELEGPKQILRDNLHRQLYMVQSVTNKSHQIEEIKDEKLPPVQLIKVPDEDQEKRVLYDEFDMTVNPDTPRSFNYPIGSERRLRDEAMRADFEPFLRVEQIKKDDNPYHQEAVADFRKKVLNCTRARSEQTSLETDMLGYDGRIYDNAAYLSNTLAETENCLRELGYEIVETMYLNDPDVIKDYEEHVEKLHVDSTSVDFNPKFCGEKCSLKAVVDAERTRMAEFQKYLCQLLNESPVEVFENVDILDIDDIDDVPFMGDEVNEEPRIRPMAFEKVRLRKEPEIRHRHLLPASSEQQKETVKAKIKPQTNQVQKMIKPEQQQRAPESVQFFEGMEVPMIDESEL